MFVCLHKEGAKSKSVFVAHEISGDVEGNLRKVTEICRRIHSEEILPVFPSFTWRHYLGNSERDKALAEKVNEEYFRGGMVDEVWLFGARLSDGMKKEVRLAVKYNIPVIPKTKEMEEALQKFLTV